MSPAVVPSLRLINGRSVEHFCPEETANAQRWHTLCGLEVTIRVPEIPVGNARLERFSPWSLTPTHE